MSNPKTAINEIKKLMVQFGFMSEESVMASFKLEDNTILQASKLEVGNDIVKINEEFEQVKLEDGSYRLVENFNIDVVDGKITAVKEIFVEAKLEDGTIVKVEGDSLAEGAKVLVVTPDAEIPAPDGVHKLSDGTEIETKDGMIVTIKEVSGDSEAPAAEVPEAPVAEVGMSTEVMDMLKEFISKMGEKMSQMEQSYSSLENEFNKFKSEPAGKKIRDGKTEQFNKEELNPMDAKLAAINGLRFSNKK
tara:strand:+ start:189 stop:932 length:744 start_codon:yes stop_codon:yes gene_type:complete